MTESSARDHIVEICEADFDQGEIYSQLLQAAPGQAGAVVTFVGLVRDHFKSSTNAREAVDSLTLEHYPGMTEGSIQRIVAQACERWPLLASHVVHRVGELRAQDQIVLVAVSSAHRAAAFAAAEFIMDYLKTDAIFWKKEVRGDEVHWIESTSEDLERQKHW
ncbi:MAG: molybdenum cofactor biosynthesis protein MoaE [Pseudomonadota bacterium]